MYAALWRMIATAESVSIHESTFTWNTGDEAALPEKAAIAVHALSPADGSIL
jgi:hypothetical protein